LDNFSGYNLTQLSGQLSWLPGGSTVFVGGGLRSIITSN